MDMTHDLRQVIAKLAELKELLPVGSMVSVSWTPRRSNEDLGWVITDMARREDHADLDRRHEARDIIGTLTTSQLASAIALGEAAGLPEIPSDVSLELLPAKVMMSNDGGATFSILQHAFTDEQLSWMENLLVALRTCPDDVIAPKGDG